MKKAASLMAVMVIMAVFALRVNGTGISNGRKDGPVPTIATSDSGIQNANLFMQQMDSDDEVIKKAVFPLASVERPEEAFSGVETAGNFEIKAYFNPNSHFILKE